MNRMIDGDDGSHCDSPYHNGCKQCNEPMKTKKNFIVTILCDEDFCASDLLEAIPDGIFNVGNFEIDEDDISVEEVEEVDENDLDKYKRESIKWSTDDFMDYEHGTHSINEEQSLKALEEMIRKHDASIGITWDTINDYITQFGTKN